MADERKLPSGIVTPDLPANTLVEHMQTNEASRKNKERVCVKCGKKFTAGDWNFYDLCDEDFALFDEQKMKGRFSFGKVPHFEDPKAWIESLALKNGQA